MLQVRDKRRARRKVTVGPGGPGAGGAGGSAPT